MHPLIEEAGKKASVAWLTVPGGGNAYPVWCLWLDDALHIVAGPGEQQAPGLAEVVGLSDGPGAPGAATGGVSGVRVTLRGDHGGRVVTWPAAVSTLDPDDPAWATAAPQLAGKRLNATGSAEATVARWAAGCRVYRLRPAGDPLEAGDTLPDGELAAPVRPTPATRPARRPMRLHRVRKR